MTQNNVDGAKHASFHDFEKIDMRVGRVIGIESFPEGRHSTHILEIDFGEELGIKKSLARLAPNYEGPELVNSCVIAVVNFPPRQIGKHMSEVLVLGVADSDGNVILLRPESEVPLGRKIF